jgi:hypothetical protein
VLNSYRSLQCSASVHSEHTIYAMFRKIIGIKNCYFPVGKLDPGHFIHVIDKKCVLFVTCINNLYLGAIILPVKAVPATSQLVYQ